MLYEDNQVRWNKLLPKKINFFSWRIRNERLRTGVNLVNQGIDIHSTRCPICDDDQETKFRLFGSCWVIIKVWKNIFKWWLLEEVIFLNIEDLIICSCSDHIHLPTKSRYLFNVVGQALLWVLWRYRNKYTFSQKKKPRSDTLFEDVKLISFTRISSRDKNLVINWLD